LLLSAARRLRGCDLLISHWLLPCGWIGATLSAGRPHVAIAHSGDVHLLERLPRWVACALAKRLRASHTRLVFVSKNLRSRFMRGVGHAMPAAVVAMGTEVGPPGALPPGPTTGRPLRILYMGRLVPIKGVDVLLRVAAAHPELRVTIAGTGPERERLS